MSRKNGGNANVGRHSAGMKSTVIIVDLFWIHTALFQRKKRHKKLLTEYTAKIWEFKISHRITNSCKNIDSLN